MSKSSKSCGYTGHMHVMNKVNHTKEDFSAAQAKSCCIKQHAEQCCHNKKANLQEKNRCDQSSCKK